MDTDSRDLAGAILPGSSTTQVEAVRNILSNRRLWDGQLPFTRCQGFDRCSLTSGDTAERRNGDRALPTDGALERNRMWYRRDGLVQVQGHPPLNIGVLEASKVFDNARSKFLFDIHKVVRELHDMLRNRFTTLHVTTKSSGLTLVVYVLSEPGGGKMFGFVQPGGGERLGQGRIIFTACIWRFQKSFRHHRTLPVTLSTL